MRFAHASTDLLLFVLQFCTFLLQWVTQFILSPTREIKLMRFVFVVTTIAQNIINLIIEFIVLQIVRFNLGELRLQNFLSLPASVIKWFAEFFFITIANFDFFQFRQFFLWMVGLFLSLLALACMRKILIFSFCDSFDFFLESFLYWFIFDNFNFLCNFFGLFLTIVFNLVDLDLFVLWVGDFST